MRVDLPVYVERVKVTGGHRYVAFPLFRAEPHVAHENLNRALSKLGQKVLQELLALRRQNRQDVFAAYTFAPPIRDHFISVDTSFRNKTYRGRLLFAEFPALGGRAAFAPCLPGLWFRVERGRAFEAQATDRFDRHLRHLAKIDQLPDPEEFDSNGRAWTTTLDLELPDAAPRKKAGRSIFAMLGSDEKMDGAAELERTGRCLDRAFPDGLEEAALRDREREELARLLDATATRPILLLGPTGAGKTTLIKDYVFHTVQKRRRPFSAKRNTWLLSPMRLVSGMAYVGQWEERVHAILRESIKRKHLLYFDDFLGLFSGFGSGDLSIAQVLRPAVERGDVRIITEMTPEQYRAFRERDRGFADLFHVMRVAEPQLTDATRMLLGCRRKLEGVFRCRFGPDVLQEVMDLQRRFARDQAFPGKAADFLKRMAAKYREQDIGRHDVLREFQFQSGFQTSFVDQREKLDRNEVVKALTRHVIGQQPAVEALADAIAIAKARLNHPGRPFGTFLFLGPTGVGKTQTAKALARYWFGDEDRMIRFDMNEFGDPDAAARLTGTFQRPDGLLTSAIRMQPFSVILLDEIEKADTSAHDLLLQVLGEARLTDALGRTADFSKAVIIMTSNLGAREAGTTFGFGRTEARDDSRAALYRRAAEQFFRPELYNRMDAVIPFRNLNRAHIASIAEGLVREVLGREGLARRHCVLRVDPKALEHMVEWGYHPQLGARALKRAIERELAQPLARRLCEWPASTPAVIALSYSDASAGLELQVEPLEPHALTITPTWPAEPHASWLVRLEAATKRLDALLDRMNPQRAVAVSEITTAQHFYFATRELSRRIHRRLERLHDRSRERKAPVEFARGRKAIATRNAGLKMPRIFELPTDLSLRDLLFSSDLRERFRTLATTRAEDAPELNRRRECAALLNEISLYQYQLARAVGGPQPARVLLILRGLRDGCVAEVEWLAERYADLFGARLDMQASRLPRPEPGVELLTVEAVTADLARYEAGMHVFTSGPGLTPVAVHAVQLDGDVQASDAWSDLERKEKTVGRVLRLYDLQTGALDFRAGLACSAPPEGGDFRRLLTALLPRPDEWEG